MTIKRHYRPVTADRRRHCSNWTPGNWVILIDIREIDGLRADRPGSTRSERAINGSSSVVVSRRLSSAKDGMIQVDEMPPLN